MATENVGAIQYTVDADTAAMIKAEASIQKILNNMVKSFEKIDKTLTNTANQFQSKMGASTSAVKSTESTVSKSTKSIADDFTFTGKAVEASSFKFSQGMNKTSSSVTATQKVVKTETDKIVNEINDVGEAATKAGGVKGSGIGSLNTQVSGTAKAVRGARPDMQNMSYQLQDMAVQAQMGTSAFVIMAQQLPQMLVGMGAWAGAIGVAVTVLGLLATTTIDTTTDLQRLDSAVGHAKAVMTVGADGVVEYTEKMKELGRISQLVAEFQMATAMKKAQEGVKNAVKSMADELSKVDDTVFGVQFGFAVENSAILATKSMRSYTVNVGNLLGEVGNAWDRTGDKAQQTGIKFIKLFADLNKAKTPEAVTKIQEEIIKMATASDKADKKFIKMIESLMFAEEGTEDYFSKLRALTAVLEEGAKSQTDFSNKTKETVGIMKDLTNEFALNAIRITEGERAAFKFGLQLKGLDADQVKAQMSLYDYNKELEQTKSDAEEAEEALKNVNDQLDAFFEKESADDKKKAERETTNNINFAQNIIESGKTPEQRMAEQYARLDELRQTDLENAEVYQEAMDALALQSQENRENELLESYRRIGEAAADSMGDYLSGAKTAEEATRQLASTIISQAIQSLVQMGITAMTQTAATTTAATGGIAATTTAAVTSTGVMAGAQGTAMATVAGAVGTIAGGLAASWAPAAAFASLATLGTNAAPAIAGIYATMAATLGAQLVGGLASNAIEAGTGFAGAREFGGPVTAGKSYLVGERGPEMVTMGASGQVTSNKDLTSSGSGVSVNINNYSGQNVTQNYDEVRKIVTVEIGKQISGIRSGTGSMAKALKGTTTTKGRATKA